MALEKVVISFEGDASALQPVLAKLKEMGTISDQNAEKFQKAAKKHSAAIGDTSTEVGRLENKIQSLAERFAALFALDKIIDFTKGSVEAFEKAEASAKKLAFAVKSILGEGDIVVDKLVEQSETLQSNSIFSKDSIQQAQAALATFGLTGKQIEALTPKIADLASASGEDLGSATDRVIRGLNGEMRGLKEVGINFKDTGSKTENLAILTDKLTKFQGASADQMTTLSGKTQRLKNDWEEFKVTIGGFLVEAGTQLADWFKVMFTDFSTMDLAMQRIKQMYDDKSKTIADSTIKEIEADNATVESRKKATDAKIQLALDQLKIYDDEIAAQKDATVEQTKSAKLQQDAIIALINKLGEYRKSLDDTYQIADDATSASAKAFTNLTDQITAAQAKLLTDYYNALKKGVDAQTALLKDQANEQIKDKEALSVVLLSIEQDSIDKKLNIDEELARIEHDAAVKKVNDTYALQSQKDELILALDNQLNQNLQNLETEAAATKANNVRDNEAEIIKIRKEAAAETARLIEDTTTEQIRHAEAVNDKMLDMAKNELGQKKADGLISEQEYNVAVDKLELARYEEMKKNLIAEDQLLIDDAQKKLDIATAAGEDTRQLQLDLDEAKNKLDEDQLDSSNKIAQAQIKLTEDTAAKQKEIWKSAFDVFQNFMTAFEDAIQANIDAIDTQMTRQNQMIDYQKTLAEKGLANDLAFEEKKADQLAEKKLKEQRKLERAKELETFLNSVAKFSEDNPNSAVAKALGVLAATKAAEALFAEEGGVVGSRLPRAFGRRHKSGRDRLVMAEDGEGILSKREMDLLGGESGFMKMRNFIKDPLRERMIPSSHVSIMRNDNSEIVKELNAVKKAVENIPQMRIEWDGLDARIETKIQNGVEERMKVLTGKRRL